MSEFKGKKKSKWIITAIFAVLLVFLIIFVGNMIYSQITNKVPSFFGYSVMNIISTSMEPQIPENTFILIKKVDPAELKVGDVITFYSKDPTIRGLPNTHRITDIRIENGNFVFITKGDANAISDAYEVDSSSIIGVYQKNLITLGKAGRIFQSRTFIFILLVVPAVLLFVFEIINLAKTAKNVEKEKIEGKEADNDGATKESEGTGTEEGKNESD
jgi:signal peptidase